MAIVSAERFKWIAGVGIGLLIAGAAVYFGWVPGREYLPAWLAGKAHANDPIADKDKKKPARYERDKEGNEFLILSEAAFKGLNIEYTKVEKATQRSSPPQPGTINFDNDRLFNIRSRFSGEIAEIGTTKDTDNINGSSSADRFRPFRYGDKLEQGDLLAVVHSKDLGQAKAALVDAVLQLRLSKELYGLQKEAFYDAALSKASLLLSERTFQGDANARLNALRALRMWKITPKEIEEIEAEAKILMDQKKVRSAEDELKWARVEIRVPKMIFADPNIKDPNDPKRYINIDPGAKLTLVEKNTHLGDMVDPTATQQPLFKLADMSRLQIWVQPPEELLPKLQEQLEKHRLKERPPLKWKIQFSAFPDAEPLLLDIVQIAPNIDPAWRTPLVIGYLPNPENKFLVGQFVTATIFMDPEENTVQIPTNAINEVEGESLVFVVSDAKQRKFALKRVAVVQRFKDVSYVRTNKLKESEKDGRFTLTAQSFDKLRAAKVPPAVLAKLEGVKGKEYRTRNSFVKGLEEALTKKELTDSQALILENADKNRETQPLSLQESVLTRGIVEMTSALETLAADDRPETKQ